MIIYWKHFKNNWIDVKCSIRQKWQNALNRNMCQWFDKHKNDCDESHMQYYKMTLLFMLNWKHKITFFFNFKKQNHDNHRSRFDDDIKKKITIIKRWIFQNDWIEFHNEKNVKHITMNNFSLMSEKGNEKKNND